MEKMKRRPSIEKKIGDITNEDKRVRLIGTLISKDLGANIITVDDGTGILEVFIDDIELLEMLEEYDQGQIIRVIGRVIPLEEDNFELRGETIETITNFDFDLYKKVKKLESQVINNV